MNSLTYHESDFVFGVMGIRLVLIMPAWLDFCEADFR